MKIELKHICSNHHATEYDIFWDNGKWEDASVVINKSGVWFRPGSNHSSFSADELEAVSKAMWKLWREL
jgi:hypothetical protein